MNDDPLDLDLITALAFREVAEAEANDIASLLGQHGLRPTRERTMGLILLACRIYANCDPPPPLDVFVDAAREAYRLALDDKAAGRHHRKRPKDDA